MSRRPPSRKGMRIEGVNEINTKLRELVDKATADDVVMSALLRGAEIMRALASAKAPVLTGELASSVFKERVGAKLMVQVGAGPGQGLGSRRSFYAHMQEFGTRHHAAQPFMRPAFEQTKRKVVASVRQDMRQAVLRVAAK